jgi:Response regulator receiver domain
LPDRDGLELVADFATRGLPTLVLSARLDTRDKVAALDLGAEEYLTKPFDGDELLARVRAILRRSGGRADGVVAYGAFVIDPSFHSAMLAGQTLDLTPREFSLLSALATGAGRSRRCGARRISMTSNISVSPFVRYAARSNPIRQDRSSCSMFQEWAIDWQMKRELLLSVEDKSLCPSSANRQFPFETGRSVIPCPITKLALVRRHAAFELGREHQLPTNFR